MIINYEYPPVGAGAGNASWFLARALVRQGIEVSVVTSAFKEFRGVSIEDGVRVHRIPALRKYIGQSGIRQMLCFAASAMVRTPRIVRAEQTENVIAFFTLPSGLVSYWLKLRHKVPYLVSLRGGEVPGLDPAQNQIHRMIGGLRRRILGSAYSVVANSPGLAELSVQTDPFPVIVIPNGVDCEIFCSPEPNTPGVSKEKLQILFVGRLQKQKNLILLLEVLARMKNEGGGGFTLHVAGDGPLGPLMRKRAVSLGLGGNIVWHGWLAKPELIALYQSVDCFVSPALFEGLPNAVLEAMACSLPVVASRIAGHDILVTDGRTGMLFGLDAPQQLSEALTRLMRDRSLARRLGANGRERAKENYSWDAMASAYLRVLNTVSLPPRSANNQNRISKLDEAPPSE